MKNIPLYFGMALAKDKEALTQFLAFPEAEQEEIIRRSQYIIRKEDYPLFIRRMVFKKTL